MKRNILALLLMVGTLYPTTMIVTDLNTETDTVTMQDVSGYEYTMKGVEDNFKGDLLSLIMDNKGTETVTDDEVIDYTYSGNPGMFIRR